MFFLRLLAMSMIFFLEFVGQSVYAQDFDFNSAIKIAKIGDDMIQTAKGSLVCTEMAMNTNTNYFKNIRSKQADGGRQELAKRTSVITYVYDRVGGRLRYEEENTSSERTFTKVVKSYDGEKTTTLTYNLAKGLLVPRAMIWKGCDPDALSTPFWYGYYLGRQDISEMLKTKTLTYGKRNLKIKYTKSEYVQSIMADAFSGTTDDGYILEFWLAKDYLYRPVKLVVHPRNKAENELEQEYLISYKKMEQDIWFPERVTFKMHLLKNGVKEDSGSTVFLDYVIADTKLNEPLIAKDFVIDIPEGLRVEDTRK